MPRVRFARPTPYEVPVELFRTAEEAWLWFARCATVREQGARLASGPGETCRPCDPDDIYRAVVWLARVRRIGRRHLKVLAEFGKLGVGPDPRVPEEAVAAHLWEDALDRLTTVLRRKGILA